MPSEIFELRDNFIELNKLLKIVSFCASGGEAKQVISQGLIEVDGQVEYRKRCKIRSGQLIQYGEHQVKVR
jgi:ribosome-associated protein